MTIPFRYSDGGRCAAGFRRATDADCVARAIAIAIGLPYRRVYKTLAECENAGCAWGKRPARFRTPSYGVSQDAIDDFLVNDLGWTIVRAASWPPDGDEDEDEDARVAALHGELYPDYRHCITSISWLAARLKALGESAPLFDIRELAAWQWALPPRFVVHVCRPGRPHGHVAAVLGGVVHDLYPPDKWDMTEVDTLWIAP